MIRRIAPIFFSMILLSCNNPLGDGNEVDSGFDPGLGGGNQSDTTAPSAVGSIAIVSNNGAYDRSVSVDWSASPGSDDSGAWSYQIAIGYDDDSDGFDSTDVNNLVDWKTLSGGKNTTTYQVIDGLDGFSFEPVFNKEHFISIRLVDDAGNVSDTTSTSAWYTFIPKHLTNISLWLDSSDQDSLFTDPACTSPVTNDGDLVGCWLDKSGLASDATASGADRPTYSNNPAIEFTGAATTNDTGECFDIPSTNAQTAIFVIENAATASNGIHGLLGHTTNDQYWFLSTSLGYTMSFDGTGTEEGRFAINGASFSSYAGNAGASNLNGSEQIISAEAQNPHTDWVNLGCFNHDNGPKTYRANYDLKEIVLISNTLSASELEKLEGYLACKWNLRSTLDLSHAYYHADNNSDDGCP